MRRRAWEKHGDDCAYLAGSVAVDEQVRGEVDAAGVHLPQIEQPKLTRSNRQTDRQ